MFSRFFWGFVKIRKEIFLRNMVLTFWSVVQTMKCEHSLVSYWTTLSCGAVCFVIQCDSSFLVRGSNQAVLAFIWNLVNSALSNRYITISTDSRIHRGWLREHGKRLVIVVLFGLQATDHWVQGKALVVSLLWGLSRSPVIIKHHRALWKEK